MEYSSESPLSDHLLGKRQRRHAPVVIPDHVGDAGALYRLDHAYRLGKVATERLFTRHQFAGLRCRHGDLGMRVIGTGDVDEINVVAFDQSAPVCLVETETPLGSKIARLVFVARAYGNQIDAGLVGKKTPYLMICVGVSPAHEASPNETHPQVPVFWQPASPKAERLC